MEPEQRRGLRVALEHDIATVTAVATVGAGERLELLALHRDAPVAAVARVEVKRDLVDEGSHDRVPSAESRLLTVLDCVRYKCVLLESPLGRVTMVGRLKSSGEPKLARTRTTTNLRRAHPRC